jgi:GNS1/SUR4 family
MKSPVPMFQLFAVYIVFVYIIGPLFMRNRKAYDLNNATRLYNILQISACAYIVPSLFRAGFKFEGTFDCSKNVSKETEMKLLNIWYFIAFTRVVELIETVFFILRQKQSQASYLHVYHHIGSIFGAWLALKYDASK